ncbi:hypothetical protein FI667_g15447, partial [Globisporangium splendens]
MHLSDSHDHASVHVLHDFLAHWREDDDLALEVAASEQSHSSTPDEDASSNADDAPPARRPRRNRYAEVAQLQEQVKMLEDELVTVREQWKRKSSSAVRHRAIVKRNGAQGEVTWSQMASREVKLLRRSEHATHELRDNIHKNRNAVKDVRRLLMKTRRLAVAATMNPLSRISRLYPDRVLSNSSSIFQTLFHDIESMKRELSRVDALLTARNSELHEYRTLREWNVREGPSTGLFLECIDCCTVPFDRVQVHKGILRLHGEPKQADGEPMVMEYFYATDDTIARQYVVHYDNNKHAGYVRLTEVAIHYSDDTQSVVLVLKNVQPVTATGEPIDAIVLRDRKWIIVRSRGNDDCAAAGCATSTIESYQKMTPQEVRIDLGGQWNRQLLEEAFIELCDESVSNFHRRLETSLVQQGMQNNRRFQAAEV